MNKILVAVDGGKKSQKIIDWALDMAAQENALLVAVNVFVPSSWHYSNFTYAYASRDVINKVYEDDIKTINGWLLEIKQKAESKNISVETEILLNPIINPVSDAIAKYTQENISKIIIVGSSNKKGLRGIFHTDIAAELIKNVSCPVVVN